MMKKITGGVVFFGLLCGVTLAHMKIVSPTPRDATDTQTTGPCGNVNNDFTGTVTELTPGETLDIVLTSNTHGGLYRVALSQEGVDTYDCVLIDHVPQYSGSATSENISIVVPDVKCDTCAIQVYMVVPSTTTTCCDKAAGECDSTAWYSCANVKINGKKERSEFQCSQPCTWAYRDEKPGVYRSLSNNGLWIPAGTDTYLLNTTGGYYKPLCQNVSRSECPRDDGDGESRTDILSEGGELSAGGVIGIIVVILVLLGIAITWFLAVKNKRSEPKPFSPMMANSAPQAIVQVDGEQDNTTHSMPPPPPQRV